MDLLIAMIPGILTTLITAFLLFVFRGFYKEYKSTKNTNAALTKEEERRKIKELIHEETRPILDELEELYHRVEGVEFDLENCEKQERQDIAAIRVSYRFRLISLCKSYIHKGYMTTAEYEQLSEFFRVYREIGGNGQAAEWYNRASALSIRDDEE